ncbi:MAG: carbohydrate ABC transporter permease [Brevinematales bacterium]|nr:carbohydrate ABC transporter permease [Brevinematales bacterium]
MRKVNYVLLQILLVVSIVVLLLPVFWILLISFYSKDVIRQIFSEILRGNFHLGDITLSNYTYILSDPNFLRWVLNSAIVASGVAFVSTFIGFMAGYGISRYNFPGKKPFLISLLATQLFPIAMMIVPFLVIASILGIIGTLHGLSLAYLATTLPFSIWILKGFFDTVPHDMEEAAEVDGANLFQLISYILIPIARPALATSFIFSFITCWNEYAISFIFLSDVSLYTLPPGIKSMLDNNDIAGFSAAVVLVSVPVVLLFMYIRKELVESVTLGAVKE